MENRIVVDTNVMISFLIGKRLRKLKDRLSDLSIKLILTDQLINELKLVTSRPKFKKYFDKKDVNEFIDLISIIGLTFQIKDIPKVCRDPKDNFLLSLCVSGNAAYLVTGDKDLLDLVEYKGTKIIRAAEFEKLLVRSFH
jgi:putative PIN family toxin of toxin-antitoxin system